MPRSFLVKKYFAKQKPNYSELECQNGEYSFLWGCESIFAKLRKPVETTCFLKRVCDVLINCIKYLEQRRFACFLKLLQQQTRLLPVQVGAR